MRPYLPATLFAIVIAALLVACGGNVQKGQNDLELTHYVDPYIGTGEHGHVFMGANVPFGLVQLGPSNISEGWDWTSGYHISDSTIFGFSHMHLSGTGIGDLGDINILPIIGEVKLARGRHEGYHTGMYSTFDRANEESRAGYYAVHLDRYNIGVELTATQRVGFHKYIFPQSDDARVVVDLNNGLNWDKPTETYIVKEGDNVLSGYRFSTGWAKAQKIFFTAHFSKPIEGLILQDSTSLKEGTELKGVRVMAQALFSMEQDEELYIKVALSPTSIENAKMNMEAELPDWDFEQTVAAADNAWNKELNKIQITTEDESVKRIFYTGMYHSMIAPSVFCDVNGDYYGADNEMHKGEGFVNYTTFSLWDTYRAAHPLMTIIHPEKMGDIINTMLTIYKQQGRLPVWHLMGCETDCMVGNSGVPVVADAILKGYTGFDKELAYEAIKNSMMGDERGLEYYKKYGYIPYEKHPEALSYAMEYAIDDWAVAQVAKEMGNREDYDYFLERSKAYKYYFDKETGFVRGLDSEGNFRAEFDPFKSVHRANDYTEGNAWQYTWLVPHDAEGLAECFGGREHFISKLDSLFIVEGDLGDEASPDISGLIGQYAHGNEPSHHVIYMYPYVGQPWKTAQRAREVMSRMYDDTPEGIAGNEDVGQISSWYILSAMGFYQVEPAGGKYIFGSPVVDKAVIRVGEGKTFTVKVHNNSPENIYIESVKLNGAEYDDYFLRFEDIAKGGVVELTMCNQPSESWGRKLVRINNEK